MIYIISGDDTVRSRKRLVELCDKKSVITLDGKTLQKNVLEENLVSTALFGEEKGVVVENITKNSKKKDLLTFLNSHNTNILTILWDDKKTSKTSFSALKSAKVEEYLLPTYYFKFLDTLSPQNKKQSYMLFHELLSTYAPEQVFYSLLKRARQLVIISSGAKSDEIIKMSSWQLANLKRQLQMWSKESLFAFYESLRQTEIKLKTGKLPVNLAKHLDILILSQLT